MILEMGFGILQYLTVVVKVFILFEKIYLFLNERFTVHS